MSAAPGKTEFRLEFSDRRGIVEVTGPEADARRIQTILFSKGHIGEFGIVVDVQSYLFEFGDEETRNTLEAKAREMIMKYCPNVSIKELSIQILDQDGKDGGKKNSLLAIAISLGTASGTPYEFAIVVTSSDGKTIVSNLVL